MKMFYHEDHDMNGGGTVSSPEERLALLKYMLSHNAHHAEELHELAHSVSGEAHELIHLAVDRIEESNKMLEKAVCLLENDSQ